MAPRIRAKGRLKWRDIHATSGILALAMVLVFITTGMPWSAYWGNTLSAVNTTLTPGPSIDAPSTLAKAGDLDRFGRHIPWDTQQDPVPASTPSGNGTTGLPARFSLTDVAHAAQQEGMQPGYDIVLPINEKNAKGQMVYGSYQLANPWPGRINTDKTIYLDQFTGKKLAQSDSSSSGAIGQATSFGVYIHMGTEFGVIDRIIMTTGALLLLVSIGTSLVMWWIRHPHKRAGLPKRPADPRLPWTLVLIGLVIALIYPLWGVSVLVVLMLDQLVIRRVGRLRSAIGMPTATKVGPQFSKIIPSPVLPVSPKRPPATPDRRGGRSQPSSWSISNPLLRSLTIDSYASSGNTRIKLRRCGFSIDCLRAAVQESAHAHVRLPRRPGPTPNPGGTRP